MEILQDSPRLNLNQAQRDLTTLAQEEEDEVVVVVEEVVVVERILPHHRLPCPPLRLSIHPPEAPAPRGLAQRVGLPRQLLQSQL